MNHPSIVPVRDEWLARRTEEPLAPELPIVDAHHHCLAFPGYRYYEEEFLADIQASGHNIVASIHAETGGRGRGCSPDDPELLRPVGETRALVAGAKALPEGAPQVSLGIVGFADLFLGTAVCETLDAHVEAGKGRFKGIRQITPWDADASLTPEFLHAAPNRLADPKFREGFAELARRELSFDSWIYGPQIPELAALADAFPDATIVLDHCGTPVMQGGYARDPEASFANWAKAMVDLARRENVFCKLGGLAKWISDLTFHQHPEPPSSQGLAGAWQRWIETCIACFGPARCMFESNFPQEKPSCSYGVFWNGCKRMAAQYSADEQLHLFAGTAARAYRLPADL
ncbi:MAG: amidohydrolase family protein [Novosphingobium sp.]|nr:amidohydrolase family protein [Novosphingobium sp.]